MSDKKIVNISNSGFLDDLLFDHTINFKIESSSDFNKMINELYKIVEDKFKPLLYIGQTHQEFKIIMDRTFNSWDLFVNRLIKHKYFLAEAVKKCSYKSAFMKDEKRKNIYYGINKS